MKLPNRAAALDGSSSTDDYGIVSYSWSRDIKSPAAGVGCLSCKSVKITKINPPPLLQVVYNFRNIFSKISSG